MIDDQYTSNGGAKFPIKWSPPEVSDILTKIKFNESVSGSELHSVLLEKRCVGIWGALLGGFHMRGDAVWQVGLVDLLNLMLVKVDLL